MKLSNEELTFLYQLLDQISVRGVAQKQMVLTLMAKIAKELGEDETPE